MKAVTLTEVGSKGNFVLAEVDNPANQSNNILVKIKAAAFNPIDYQMRRGLNESKLLTSNILGRELAGKVVGVGANVTGFAIGDRIAAYVGSLASNGSYAQLISIPHQLAAKIPEDLTYPAAAALPLVGLTALQCFKRLIIPNNEPVFIGGGAGGVGTILIKLLLASGHNKIVTTAGNAQSKQHLIDTGLDANDIIDYLHPAYIKHLQARTTTGVYKYCIDLVGGNMSEVCAFLLSVHGVYVDITNLVTAASRELLFDKAATIINVANYAYTLSGNISDTAIYGKQLAELFAKIEQGIIVPAPVSVVGGLSVETAALAHTLMEDNKTGGKKLVMLVDESNL